MQRGWEGWLYEAVGRVMGYGVAPAALAVFGAPFFMRLPDPWRLWTGYVFLLLAMLGLLGNAFLAFRRQRLGQGASPFPFCVLAHGISSGALLLPDAGLLPVLLWILVALALDFFGPWVAAAALVCLTGKAAPRVGSDSDDRGPGPA